MDDDLAELYDLWSNVSRADIKQIADLASRVLRAPLATLRSFEGGRDALRYASDNSDLLQDDLPEDKSSQPVDSSQPIDIGAPSRDRRWQSGRLDAPLYLRSGAFIGTLSVFDAPSRAWSEDDHATLRDLAGCLADRIALSHRAARPLSQSESPLLLDGLPVLVFESRDDDSRRRTSHWFGSEQTNVPALRQILEGGRDDALDLVHPDDRDTVIAAMARSAIDASDVDVLFRVTDADTSTRWLRLQSVVRRDETGATVRTGICSDVTDMIAARDGADKQAVVDVNHELRTPLQAIIGFTEFLKRETRPDAIADHAKTIQSAAESLLSIVNKTLAIAGNGVDAPSPAPDEVALRPFAESCMSLVAPLIIEKRLASSIVIDLDVPGHAVFDRQRVQQALLNLLNNAVKFTDSGDITLHVSRADDGIRFGVSDTGIGIPPEKLALLFHRFSRIESSDRATGGTGLGLSITKTLVETLGGDIGVETREGGGTMFWFAIPFASTSVRQEPRSASAPAELASNEDDETASAHILLADDLDLNRKLICDMLALEGHVVDSVADGAAAVKAAGEHPYDLILMDMIMPGMDGIAATRAIRALPAPACEVPIVALTAHSFREQLESCIQAGMDATLTKPMSLDALTSAVATWTRRRRKAA